MLRMAKEVEMKQFLFNHWYIIVLFLLISIGVFLLIYKNKRKSKMHVKSLSSVRMDRWIFKNTLLYPDGKVIFTELSEGQKKRIPDYIEVLRVAHSSDVPRPSFSNYFCKEAIGPVGGLKLAAGNIEYGVCKALHGEEAAVAAFRAYYRRKEKNQQIVLGIATSKEGKVPRLCGNCRDILFDEFGLDLEIIAGTLDGGLATVTSMRDYLFDDFEEFRSSCIDNELFSYYVEMRGHWG